MKDCNLIQKPNHLMFTMLYLLTSVVLIFILFTTGAYGQTINGTATGNIMNGGYAAATDDYSVYADTANGYALMLEKDGQTITADSQNAGSINACGNKVYYVSVNGAIRVTKLCVYDVNTKEKAVLLTVPLAEGMKNLYVLGDVAYYQSDNKVKTYDLNGGSTELLFDATVQSFAPADGGVVFMTFNGTTTELKAYDYAGKSVTTLAQGVISFDTEGNRVYYSDGESGLFVTALDGGSQQRLAEGATNIVCRDGEVYWQNGEEVLSSNLNGKKTAVEMKNAEEVTSFSVLDTGVESVSEEIGEPGSSDEAMALSSVSAFSLPDGNYKDWKQGDPRWGSNALGSSTIKSIGCLATAVSILLVGSGAEKERYMAGTFDPGVFVKEMTNNGGFTGGGGMIWSGINKVEPSFSVYRDTRNGSSFGSLSKAGKVSAISDHLSAGRYITICVDNPSTGNTHWVAADYVSDGAVYECDPGYSNKSENLFQDYTSVTRLVIFEYSGEKWSGGTPTNPTPPPNVVVTSKYFTDVTSNYWYYSYVEKCAELGFIKGYEDKTFRPYNNMTRAEFVTLLSNFNEADISNYEDDTFEDVAPTAWYVEPINWAVAKEIVNGVSEDSFAPNNNITREQLCVVLMRFADMVGVTFAGNNATTFTDQSKISSYALSAVKRAQAAGLINGYSDGSFGPQKNATRAEIAKIMTNFLNNATE